MMVMRRRRRSRQEDEVRIEGTLQEGIKEDEGEKEVNNKKEDAMRQEIGTNEDESPWICKGCEDWKRREDKGCVEDEKQQEIRLEIWEIV